MAVELVKESLTTGAPNDVWGLGVTDVVLSGLAGLLAAAAIYVWGIPGLDPAMWNEVAAEANFAMGMSARALKALPDSPEVKQTLADALKKAL